MLAFIEIFPPEEHLPQLADILLTVTFLGVSPVSAESLSILSLITARVCPSMAFFA